MSTAQMFTREHIIPQLVVWFNSLPDDQRIVRPTDVPFFNVKVIQDPAEPTLSKIVMGDTSLSVDPTLVLGEATFTWAGRRHLTLPRSAVEADFFEVAKNVAMLNLQQNDGATHIGTTDGSTVQSTLNDLADSLGNDPNFATTITSALATKVNSTDFVTATGGDPNFAATTSTALAGKVAATDLADSIAPNKGAALVGFSGRTVANALADVRTIKHFGAVGDGITDDTTAIQNAANSGCIIFPSGPFVCKITSTISVAPGTFIAGMGHGNSNITTALDIEIFRSTLSIDARSAVADIAIHDMKLERTLPGASYTTYHIRLRNPSRCILSGLFLTQGGTYVGQSTRTGGLWLEAGAGTTYPGSVNKVYDCIFDNASLYVQARDNHFSNLWVWGQNLNKSVYVEGSGNYFDMVEAIPSPSTAAFYFNSSAQGCLMNNCIVDGSTSTIITGTGVYANKAYGLRVSNCYIYNVFKHGVHFVDMLEGAVTDTRFTSGNRINDPNATGYDSTIGYDDIRLESLSFASNGLIITDNTFSQPNTRTTKGYAVREFNGGTAPGPSVITNNYVPFGQYTSPNILRLNAGTSMRNNNGSSAASTRASGIATVLSGTSSITVSHGLSDANVTDAEIYIRPTSSLSAAGAASWYATKTSTSQFAITLNASATANVTFVWSVDLK